MDAGVRFTAGNKEEMDNSEVFVSREELHEMMWTTPTQIFAKTFSISDVALGRMCKKLGVPKPPRGYWAKKLAGGDVKVVALPPKSKNQRPGVYLAKRQKEEHEPIRLSDNTADSSNF